MSDARPLHSFLPSIATSARYACVALLISLTACGERQAEVAPAVPPPSAEGVPAAPGPQPQPNATATPRAQASGLPDFTVLVERQGPAVVNVVTTRKAARGGAGIDLPDDPIFDFFRRFMPNPPDTGPESRGQGIGSGFIISADGFILTNAHVVAESDEVVVRLADAREFKGKIVGVDTRTDVALLKVTATGLPTVTLGNSENLKVGEWVAAIGSPFGFANTITAGIVSAKGRSLPDESFVPFIQTDVAVNPGNSGGPLLNLSGEVVGINSAIYSRTGGYMGVSFAIPIEVALDVSKQLQQTGKVTRGRLGVQIQALTPELAKSFKLADTKGVLVASVEPGSPAAKAGLQSGDVILSFDGKLVQNANELPRIVAATKPGTPVTLEISRDGARRQVKATLTEFASEPVAAQQSAPDAKQAPNRLGLTLRELLPAQRKALGVEYGLLVEGVASQGGQVQRGDIIIAVNNVYFKSADEFNRIVQQQPAGGIVALLVRRGDAALYIPMRVGAEGRK
ncbi:MAG TPA: DegQ family serine endoprotease [Burkholderiales bacterium]|nr:DegQ family serine endoprotease [Burkholderiales bacterium]